MNNELALRTIGYLIGHYKTHNETIINSQEIEAIEFIIKENQKYKEVIDKAIEYIESKEYEYGDEEQDNYIYDIGFDEINELLDILRGMK